MISFTSPPTLVLKAPRKPGSSLARVPACDAHAARYASIAPGFTEHTRNSNSPGLEAERAPADEEKDAERPRVTNISGREHDVAPPRAERRKPRATARRIEEDAADISPRDAGDEECRVRPNDPTRARGGVGSLGREG